MMTRKDKPYDSSRKSPLKIDHEVVAADDELELGFWSGEFFQGSAGKIIYDWSGKFREAQGKSLDKHMLELK